MVFNDTTNRKGIIQEIEKNTDLGIGYISGNTDLMKDFTADINVVGSEVFALIYLLCGNWQYDDSNYTDLPQAVTDLVSSQALYSIPDTALTIQRVEIKDPNGDWIKLTPIIKEQINIGIDELLDANGTPRFYRVINGTIELFAAPNYNSTGGLKIYFDRANVDFVVGDTTKTPGFASFLHDIIPVKTAIRWFDRKQPTNPNLARLLVREAKLEALLTKHYSKRFKDYKPKITREHQSYK